MDHSQLHDGAVVHVERRRIADAQDRWFRIVVLDCEDATGARRQAWSAVERLAGDRVIHDVVIVFPALRDGSVRCVEMLRPPRVPAAQYGQPNQLRVLELPAGLGDVEGETVLAAAKRELREETGCVSERFIALPPAPDSSGVLMTRVHLFLALDCTIVGSQRLGPGERRMGLRCVDLPIRNLPEAILRYAGETGNEVDPKIMSCYAWWQHFTGRRF